MTYDKNPDDLLKLGIEVFNAGDYYRAHELWEDLWRQTSGPPRDFYQGLIHVAVGLHHLNRDNQTGARSQLTKALHKLEKFTAFCCGINNAALQMSVRKVLNDKDAMPVHILTADGN